ncbi:hypothetical protein ACFL4W_02105 [Planctomycetota bacterium]
MKCYICSQPAKKKNTVVVADTYQDLLKDLLKGTSNDVHALCLGAESSVVNGITMQYFHQFDLFAGEQRDMTLQMDWVMNPPQRFGIVTPRIPQDKCLFMLAHKDCLDSRHPQFLIGLDKVSKLKQALDLTDYLSKQDWFNQRGWVHLCTDLYGSRKSAEIEKHLAFLQA